MKQQRLFHCQSVLTAGADNAPEVSAKELTWAAPEGQRGKIRPFVVELPIALWGREVLSQMNMILTTEYSPTSKKMMLKAGYIPGKGLGQDL